ncbi:NYN domain-containing protein [Candidatus Gracilibacteria bacterium]|nr:NYN domain-containing protein [Candidatus Gracilibacteria bacterium]
MTFNSHIQIINSLIVKYPNRIIELEKLFQGDTNMYIDYANVLPWQNKLGWNIDLKRMRQFFCGFDTIKSLNLYYGTLLGDIQSKKFIEEVGNIGFTVKTKDVKIMKKSIDVSSIPSNSPIILENFIRKPLLDNLKISDIEGLNTRLKELNSSGVLYLEDRKCNFDVEMGTDILLDLHFGKTQTFVIWSGDSDFYDIVKQLQKAGKNVYIFATARKVSRELSESGAVIYDIQKIRDLLCWKRQIRP